MNYRKYINNMQGHFSCLNNGIELELGIGTLVKYENNFKILANKNT